MGAIEDYIASIQGRDYYDNRLAAAARNALLRSADFEAQYKTGREQLQGQYDYDSNTINQTLEKALQGLEGDFGDRGTIRSSIYVDEMGNTNQRAQQQLQAAALRRTQGLAALESAKRSGQTDLLGGLGLENADATSRRAAALHQAELERRQQEYNQQMLDYQRQQQESQANYYAQQAQLQQQAQAQQADYHNRMIAAMQPVQNPQGQVSYPATQSREQQAAQAVRSRPTGFPMTRGSFGPR